MLQGQALFESELEHCPARFAEEHKCVGRFNIYAYLKVTGPIITGFTTPQGAPVGTPQIPSWGTANGKILPYKTTIPFKIDFSDTPTSDDEVLKCSQPGSSTKGAQPVQYIDGTIGPFPLHMNFIRPATPAVTLTESDNCLSGTVDFQWLSYRVSLAGGVGGGLSTAAPIVPLGQQVQAQTSITGASGVGGTPFPLQVSFEICYADKSCGVRMITPDTTTDAKSTFASGGSP